MEEPKDASSRKRGRARLLNIVESPNSRLEQFNWTWFSSTMSTGSLAVALYQTPHKFNGLLTIGKIIFILDLTLFTLYTAIIAARFTLKPNTFRKSLVAPGESFFFGSFWVSISLILQNISQYAFPSCGPWLVQTLEVLFWIYFGLILIVAIFQYQDLFVERNLRIADMTPAWILPIYPLLVTGPLAAVIMKQQPQRAAEAIWAAGLLAQGLGWMVSVFMYALWTIRLLSADLPPPSMRPSMYIAVGPVGYTIVGLISLSSNASKGLPVHFLGAISNASAAETIKVTGAVAGIFLWLLAFWFFGLTTVSILRDWRKMRFNLGWWAFIFPNVGLTLATIQIGGVLNSDAILWVSSAMTAIMVAVWLTISVCQLWDLWKGTSV